MPSVHALPHWNWDADNCAGLCVPHPTTGEPAAVDVWAYSNTASVELVLNGVVVGNKTVMPPQGHVEWPKVPYASGTLECRGLDTTGAVAVTHTIRTAGAPAQLSVELEQGGDGLVADKDDVALAKISVLDANGNFCPTASSHLIRFALEGPGQLIGVGNGDPSSHEPDKATTWSVWNGLARAIVQATDAPGTITLTASADGLKSASVTIKSAAPAEPLQRVWARRV